MSTLIVHGFTLFGSIDATIDGHRVSVPNDAGNRDRALISAWEAEGNTIAPYVPPAPVLADVVAERDRRLGLGFDYDFGDARGVHHIGTSPQDMIGWNDVTMAANAILATGAEVQIDILTETGPATITAMEWQLILLAAAAARQPVWQASFVLSAMTPIPANFPEDAYWHGQ